MIDLHCHILPGVDDGARTLDEAVSMCRLAAADGCQAMIATPHQRDSPGGIEPRSFWNAFFWSVPLQLACAVRPPPPCTLVYAFALQLDTSAPPIGA